MRAVVLALAALVVAAAFVWWRMGTAPTRPAQMDAASDAGSVARPPPPDLAAPPPRPGIAPTPTAPLAPTSSPLPAARRIARVRLVAVDATRNEPVDPHAAFRWSFAVGCDEQEVAAEASPGVRPIAALLPPGADASEIWVLIDGWGYSPFRASFPIHALDGVAVEEIRVPLEPVAAAAWTTVRVVLATAGDAVTEAEALELLATQRNSPSVPSRLAVEFAPGMPRERELSVPFPAVDLVFLTYPRMFVDGGRRIWISRPLVRVESATGRGSTPATFSITRPPTAVLELELHYPAGDRPQQLDCWGSWHQAENDGSGAPRRNSMSTFNVTVEGGPDVVRLERYAGQLTGLTGHAFGFVASVTPSGPLELRLSETTHAVVEFRRAPIPPPK